MGGCQGTFEVRTILWHALTVELCTICALLVLALPPFLSGVLFCAAVCAMKAFRRILPTIGRVESGVRDGRL